MGSSRAQTVKSLAIESSVDREERGIGIKREIKVALNYITYQCYIGYLVYFFLALSTITL